MTEADIEKIITAFKEANQSLRKRAITLGILMVLTLGLTYTESTRLETVTDLLDYQYQLKEINKLQDTAFQRVVNGDNEKYFPLLRSSMAGLERIRLFEKVRFASYDKKIIEDAIDNIDSRIEDLNKEKAINIFGLNIPIRPVTYVSLLILLVLFHDFTQIIIYRNQIYRRIRGLKIPRWKLGFELFGFYHSTNNPSLKFLRFTSSIISGVLTILPLITSFMLLGIDNHSNSTVLSIMNIICFAIIVIDTVIILYTENVWNFRFYANRFLGHYPISRRQMRYVWLFPMFPIISLELSICSVLDTPSPTINVLYFVLGIVPLALLYFSLEKTHDTPTKFWRAIRAGLLIVNAFWAYALVNNAFKEYTTWNYHEIEYFAGFFVVSCLISIVIAFIFISYFSDTAKKNAPVE